MNDHFRACIREVFSCDAESNEWSGRWDLSGMLPGGERRQIEVHSPVENINHPVGEREAAVAELWKKSRALGLVPTHGVLDLPKRMKHLSRYLA